MAQTFVGGIVPQKELSPGEEEQMGSTRFTPAVRKYTDNRGSTRVSNPFPDGFFSSIFGAENVDYGNILTPVQAERVEQARRNRFYSPDPVRKGFGSLFSGAEGEMTAFGPRETFVEPRSGIGSIISSFIPGANMLMDMVSRQYAPPGAPQVMSGELVKPESGGIGGLTDILNKIFSPTSKALETGANREGLAFPGQDKIFKSDVLGEIGGDSLSTLMGLENLDELLFEEMGGKDYEEYLRDLRNKGRFQNKFYSPTQEEIDSMEMRLLADPTRPYGTKGNLPIYRRKVDGDFGAGITDFMEPMTNNFRKDPDALDPRRGKYIPDPTDNQVDNFMNNLNNQNDPVKQVNEAYMDIMLGDNQFNLPVIY